MSSESSALCALAALVVFGIAVSRIAPAESETSSGLAGGSSAVKSAVVSNAAQRVVLIGVDGLHIALINDMPAVMAMFDEGAGTFRAQVPRGATTAISFAALLTGADPDVNGVVSEPTAKGKHGVGFRWRQVRVAVTLFTGVEASGRKVAAAVQKGKLVDMLRPDGREAAIVSTNDAKKLVKTACDAVRDDAVGFVFLHFKMIDDAGHRHGWLSQEQIDEARLIDDQIRQVRECVSRADAKSGVQTTLIVTADHGGTPGKGHGADTDDNRLVPWVAVGPGIRKGYAMTGRADLSLTKDGTQPAMLLYDTVPTILRILALPESSIPTLSKRAKPASEIFASP